MNIGYIFLIIMAGAAYFVSNIPTPDQMMADFKAAQKFYTSYAYDQALEKYEEVGQVESRFLDEDKVIVEFSDMQLRIKDATLYQSGNCYYKMAEQEVQNTKEDQQLEEEKEKAQRLALEYVQKGAEFFDRTQEYSINDELKVLSQKRIIDTWYLINNYENVIVEGRELIEKYPENFYVQDALYNIGWAYYDTKRFDESIQTFNELITRFPTGTKSDRALFQIGESYFDQGRYSEAADYYRRLVTKMRIDELTDLEIQKIQRDKLAGLTDETALDLAAKAALKVGACFGNAGQYDEASASYKRIASLFKYDKNLIYEAYTRLANMYYDKGDFDASIRAYRDAIDEVSDKILAAKMQVLICQRYFNEEYYDESITEYQHYINSYSDVAFRAGFDLDEAFFGLGRSYYELGARMLHEEQESLGKENLEQAVNTYKRIFKDFPATKLTERINFYMAMAYQETGEAEKIRIAIKGYGDILQVNSQSYFKQYCYMKMARAYKDLEEYDNSLPYYQSLIDEFPESEMVDGVYFEMGMTMRAKEDEMGSIQYFKNVSRKIDNDKSNDQLFTTARLLMAQTLLSAGQDQQVIDVISYAVEDTSVVENLYRLSQLYLLRGNARRSLEQFEEAIEDYSRAYDCDQPQTRQMASVQRAGIYIEQEQFARAERDLKELMNSDDENIRRSAQMRLAVISVRLGNSEQAIRTYLDLYNTTDDIDEKLGFLRNLIQLNSQSSDGEGLRKYATMMIETPISDGKKPAGQNFFYREEAYYFIANSYETEERYQEAKDFYVKGYETFPNSYFSSDMLIKVGVLYLTKLTDQPNALDEASLYFEDYIKKFPDSGHTEMAHYYLGFCYHNGRRFADAIKTFQSFAQKYPRSEFTPEAIFYYSDGLYNIGSLNESIEGMDLLISRYPNHEKAAEAYYTKGWAYLDLEREDDAIQSFQDLVNKYPKNEYASTALFSIADYYYNKQEYERAIEVYQQVIDMYPDTEVAEKVPETLKDLNETVAYLDFEKAWSIFSQARDTEDLNLYRQAAEMFQAIVDKYPNTESEIGAYSNMGICFEAMSRWRDAIEAYDKIIMKWEEGAEVSDEAATFARMHKDYIVANML